MAQINLTSTLLESARYEEDVEPMSTVANLADVMLVFACGLMMALITYWNVDISTVTEMLREDQVAEVQSPEDITDQLKANDGTSYIDMGRVYMDPTTGKYYMITEGGTMPLSSDSGNADSYSSTDDAQSLEGQQPSASSAESSVGAANPAGVGEVDRSQGGD